MPFPTNRIAFALRLLGVLVCSPLQAMAYSAVAGNTSYGLALAYVPLAAGWIGLINRPIRAAIVEREPSQYEFSAKSAILGMIIAFALLLVFAPRDAQRTQLISLFLAGSLVYYAIGKLGCIFIGCCRATEPFAARMPLPLFEAIFSAVLGAAAFASTYATLLVRLLTFALVALAFASLRFFSRLARGESRTQAISQADTLALFAVALCAALAAAVILR